MSIRCTVVSGQLPMIVDGRPLRGPALLHLGWCLRCQAEAVRYRAMGRELRSLAGVELAAPGWLAERVNAEIGGSAGGVSRRRTLSVDRAVKTATVAAIAGTVAVLGWRRSRAA